MLNNSNGLISYVERNLSNYNTGIMDITFDYPGDSIDNNESFHRNFHNSTGKDDFLVVAIVAFYVLTVVVVAGFVFWIQNRDIMRRNGDTKHVCCRIPSMLERAENACSSIEQEVFLPIISDNIKQ
ncbi:hypothetical protein [Ehrlichia japonica]|uniref:Uncharacterized protein n=1 Tax=Ehrlichia japonica TaxID=391036 RepID=X5GKV3_9RICK|nr:hypothetical protein [Ehrlichia japonica]AHX05038.1 hypothetical protein EHF_0211 [Ehrlichia japonica]